jgi:hypothetical protein
MSKPEPVAAVERFSFMIERKSSASFMIPISRNASNRQEAKARARAYFETGPATATNIVQMQPELAM